MKKQGVLILAAFAWVVSCVPFAMASTLCASVSIEIRQELTMDRQAFEAKMTIDNGTDPTVTNYFKCFDIGMSEVVSV